MKITDVESIILRLPNVVANGDNLQDILVIRVHTDAGITGIGEAHTSPSVLKAIIDAPVSHLTTQGLKPLLIGQDPLRINALWNAMYDHTASYGRRGAVMQAISGIDIALWDIKGKNFGAPVHRLMGGPLRTEVKAYATGTYRTRTGDPMDYICEEVAGYKAEGFSAVKLKIGFDPEADAALTEKVRETIGPEVGLMLDANHGFDAVDAIRYAQMVEHLNIIWFEEPVAPEDLNGYLAVKAATSIPLAGGECEYTRFGFREVLLRDAIDYLQPDTCAAGGLSECKKIADMANAFGKRMIPHVWGTGIGLATALQMLAVLPHNPPSRTPWEPMLEFDRSESPMRQAILTRPIEHENGIVAIPDGPGLGIEIDRDALASFTVG